MPTTPSRRAADLVVDCLVAEGCAYVFSVPGEETMDVLDALSTRSEIRHVTTRHEQGAAFMADVHGRLTGRGAGAVGTLRPRGARGGGGGWGGVRAARGRQPPGRAPRPPTSIGRRWSR